MFRKLQLGIAAALIVSLIALVASGTGLVPGHAEAAPATAAPRPTRSLGNLLYTVPAGYTAVGGAQGIMMASTREVEAGSLTGIIAIPAEMRPDAKLTASLAGKPRSEIAQAVAIAVGNLQQDPEARFSNAELVNDVRKDGYEAYRVITVGYDRNAAKQRYSAVFVMFPGKLIHVISANGFGSEAALEALSPGLDQLLASVEFRNAGGRVPRTAQSPLPPSFPIRVSAQQGSAPSGSQGGAVRPGKKRGGQCRIVQRQMCSGGFGSGMGYFCNTYPQSVCD